MFVMNILSTSSLKHPKIPDICGVFWRRCYVFWGILLPPKSHRSLSLSLVSLNESSVN